MLVVHYTGMPNAAAALARLTDAGSRVSAHYLIDEDGTVTRMVEETARAWHAGVSWWGGRSGLNDVSIGIELVNPGHEWGYRPFPEPQLQALVELAAGVRDRWAVAVPHTVGHSDVAPVRKEDPGELFPWQHLAAAGFGLWPASVQERAPDPSVARRLLERIGYGPREVPMSVLIRAFQRRFRPAQVDGWLDSATMGRITALAALCDRPPTAT